MYEYQTFLEERGTSNVSAGLRQQRVVGMNQINYLEIKGGFQIAEIHHARSYVILCNPGEKEGPDGS